MELGGYRDSREVVTASQFGMPQDEGRAQVEGDQENEGDGWQALVGDEFSLPRGVGALGAVTAGVEEA
ncbi:MAG: hypothetical protein ACLQOO_27240, partial [Terriglobia bacterium]